MRDNQNYLSKNMFYSINVTNLLQNANYVGYASVINGVARDNLSKLSSPLASTLIPNYIPYSSRK